jgi:hypothetical protein
LYGCEDQALGHVTIFSGSARRRRWSAEQKHELVMRASGPGAVVAQVAQLADVAANQIYRWRAELRADAAKSDAGFARVSLSMLADQIGALSVAVKPLFALIEAHVLAAERLHGDDTTVPRLAKHKTDIARLWNYVRDDRPFGGPAPPTVLYYYSRIFVINRRTRRRPMFTPWRRRWRTI